MKRLLPLLLIASTLASNAQKHKKSPFPLPNKHGVDIMKDSVFGGSLLMSDKDGTLGSFRFEPRRATITFVNTNGTVAYVDSTNRLVVLDSAGTINVLLELYKMSYRDNRTMHDRIDSIQLFAKPRLL